MAPKKKTPTPLENQPRRSPRLSTLSPAEEPPKKKLKATSPKLKSPKPKAKPDPESDPDEAEGSQKTIVVEHCKQCSSFKKRAVEVKKGLEEAVDGLKVLLNPQKPRRGCFEIREKNGEAFVTLLDMKRPFKPMKDLVMEDVISDIVQKIK